MRTRIPRRTAAAIVTAMTAAAVLSGCTGEGSSGVDDGTLRLFAPQGAGLDLSSNGFTEHIEEKFDVDIEWETTTGDGTAAAEKRQISLASGDHPDAYLLIPWVNIFSQAELLKLGDQGVISPLNDLIEEHAPNIQAAFEETPEWETLSTSPDGKIWGLPRWNDCFHCSYSSKLWMNSEWLEAVGMQQPATPEELRDVLRAFKNNDPNGNGVADEIPLSGGADILPYLMNPFIYMSRSDAKGALPASLGLDGDEVVVQATRDGWRDGLAFVRSLWDEGLIDEAVFTQNAEAIKAKGDNPDATIVGSVIAQHPVILVSLGQADGRDQDYDAVAPLDGPNGDPASYTLPSLSGASFVVTNKASAEEKKKLIEIVDYLVTTEGHLWGEYGTEGATWERGAEGDVPLDSATDPLFELLPKDEANKAQQNTAWGSIAQFYSPLEFRNAQVVSEDVYSPEGLERRLFDATLLYADHKSDQMFPYWNVWVPAESASELATAQTNVESLIAQANAEFVTGTRDVANDSDWEAFQSELTANGAETYVQIYQDAWEETN